MGSTHLDTYLERQPNKTKVPTVRDLLRSWLCHPKLSWSSCLLQSQAIFSVLSECWATQYEIFLHAILPFTLFSATLFPHSQFLSLCLLVLRFFLFLSCLNPQVNMGKCEHPSSEHVPLGHGLWALTHRLEILSCFSELDSMTAVA